NPGALDFIEAGASLQIPRNDDFNGERQEGIGLYQVTQKRGERWSAARAYLEPNRYRDTLNILTGVTVERVLMDAGRAWGVAYLQGGQQKQIR
ncbi:GMC family oxidoreductase N-terminal domain-containing protein, partial [Acinetobacter baumannii]